MLTRDLVLNVLKAHPNDWWTNARMRAQLISVQAEKSSSAIRHAFMAIGRRGLAISQKYSARPQWLEWQLSPTVFQGATVNTLETAVSTVLLNLAMDKKSFSAHDVTKELREAVNAGRVIVDPITYGTVFVAGKDVTKIEHEKVRELVHAAFDNGSILGYDRTDNGTYKLYVPTPDAVVSSDPNVVPPIADPAIPYTGAPTL